jgi:hypothetical protein
MIEVRYELDGGIDEDTAARTVETVLRYHQRALSGVSCPTHQQAPWLKVHGRSLLTLAVSIESCCPALSEKVEARIQDVSRRDQP